MNKIYSFWVVLIVSNFLLFVEPVTLPSTFKICQRSTPNLAKCVKESIESIRPSLATGNFGNGFVIDGLEPLKIDDIVIQRNGLHANLYNVKANGATTFRIEKLRINVEKFKVDVIVEVPHVEAYGQYKLQMNLGVLNIKGEGNARANIDKLKLKISLAGTKYIRNGQEYVRADVCTLTVKIVKMMINFENLFKNDKTLNDLGNTLINQNINLFITDIEPSLQKSLARQFLKSANQVLEKAPFNVFLP